MLLLTPFSLVPLLSLSSLLSPQEENRLFYQPMALVKLGLFLLDVQRVRAAQKAVEAASKRRGGRVTSFRKKAFIVCAPVDANDMVLIAAVTADAEGKNHFGYKFRETAHQLEARIESDSFRSTSVLVAQSSVGALLEVLSQSD